MQRPLAAPLLLVSFLLTSPFWTTWAWATTARDLSQGITIDGFAGEWAADEQLFGYNAAAKMLEEPTDDSKWGINNDITQVRVTWDAHNLYLAGEAKTWGNNLVIWVDVLPGRGMTTMSGLNSWSRNFTFDVSDAANDNDFSPDLFGATWDGNPTPHLVIYQSGTQVVDNQVGGGLFRAASTFYQDWDGRAMELAIPWSAVFANDPETRDTVVTVGGTTDTLRWFPPGQRRLKICAAITAGGDNTGGPDSAPDNTRGHTNEGSDFVYLDNFAEIDLDRNDDTGLGHGGPDGIPDWGVGPTDRNEPGRFRFKYPVPIVGVRFGLANLEFNRPAFAPDRGEQLDFRFEIQPPVAQSDPLAGIRTVDLSANVFDMRGRFIRNLYISSRRNAFPSAEFPYDPSRPDSDTWDGRDASGQIVPPGVYIVRMVIEPNLSRQTRAVVVVR
ncbi:MAG: hypothetical protein E4H17_01045 [Gemmatimonadales bacterium]|nr:MAG: hypothetical protein E4H17_01045 [Gemmatimonadales bacterium]